MWKNKSFYIKQNLDKRKHTHRIFPSKQKQSKFFVEQIFCRSIFFFFSKYKTSSLNIPKLGWNLNLATKHHLCSKLALIQDLLTDIKSAASLCIFSTIEIFLMAYCGILYLKFTRSKLKPLKLLNKSRSFNFHLSWKNILTLNGMSRPGI